MEVPAAFREFAEKSVSQAKDTYERMKSAAEEATDVLEGTTPPPPRCVRLWPQGNRGGADQYNATVRLLRDFVKGEVLFRAGRAVDLAMRASVRGDDRADQGLAAIAQRVNDRDRPRPVKDSMTKAFKKVG